MPSTSVEVERGPPVVAFDALGNDASRDYPVLRELEKVYFQSDPSKSRSLCKSRGVYHAAALEEQKKIAGKLKKILLLPEGAAKQSGLVRRWNELLETYADRLKPYGVATGNGNGIQLVEDMIRTHEHLKTGHHSKDLKTYLKRSEALLPLLLPLSHMTEALATPNAHREEAVLHWADNVLDQLSQLSFPKRGKYSLAKVEKSMKAIRSAQASIKALTDFPRLASDGLVRSHIYAQKPDVLRRNREKRGLDPDVCDVVVIGGGPAGIATAHNLGRLGVDTLLFESGYLAQSMSDARARSVHVMRTNAQASSLFRRGVVPRELAGEHGMVNFLRRSNARELSREARTSLEKKRKIKLPGAIPSGNEPDGLSLPVARSEVYHYFLQLADEAADCDSVTLLEQSPIRKIELQDDWTIEITSVNGHKIRTRKLAVCCGFVGPESDFCRMVPALSEMAEEHPDRVVLLQNEHDLYGENARFGDVLSRMKQKGETTSREQVVITDGPYGHPEVEQYIRLLPPCRALIAGSGETAVKAALDIRALNPNVKVDLYVKGRLEPSQFQFPIPPVEGDFVLRSMFEPSLARDLLQLQKSEFGSPVTPTTMEEVLEEVRAGGIRVFELGGYFSKENLSIELEDKPEGVRTVVRLGSNEDIIANLRAQEQEWREQGLLPGGEGLLPDSTDKPLSVIEGPIFVAAGYERSKLHMAHPVFRELQRAGLVTVNGKGKKPTGTGEFVVESSDRVCSATNENVAIVGPGNLVSASDGAFAGIGVRAYLTAEQFAYNLAGGRGVCPEVLKAQHNVKRWQDREARRGVDIPKGSLERHSPDEQFPGNSYLIDLGWMRESPWRRLSKAQQMLLERGRELQERMNAAWRKDYQWGVPSRVISGLFGRDAALKVRFAVKKLFRR